MDTDIIAERVNRVVTTFQAARTMSESTGVSAELKGLLNNSDEYFRSVAYEGAAMGLAIRDLSNGVSRSGFPIWSSFLECHAAEHAVQVHIGLGWALAEKMELVSLAHGLSDQDSVIDGYGYYHALFFRRSTIRTQSIPTQIGLDLLPYFDRGVGRSLWYISKGDLDILQKMVSAFADERKPHLWLGIGIAAAYVGGCTDAQMTDLYQTAGPFQLELLKGGNRTLTSRMKAGTALEDAERACSFWAH